MDQSGHAIIAIAIAANLGARKIGNSVLLLRRLLGARAKVKRRIKIKERDWSLMIVLKDNGSEGICINNSKSMIGSNRKDKGKDKEKVTNLFVDHNNRHFHSAI